MLQILLLLALVGGGAQLIFLYLLRPIVIQKLRYSLFALRDELRILALKKEIPEDEKAYRILESHLNVSVTAVGNIDIADLLLLRSDKLDEMQASESLAIIDDSTAEIRGIHKRAMKCIMAALLVNSPILFCIVPSVLFFALFVYRVQRFVEVWKARAWTVSSDPNQCFAT